MTDPEIIEILWNLAKPKDSKGAWRQNLWPVIRTGRGDLERGWKTVMHGKSEAFKSNTLGLIKLAFPILAKQRKGEGSKMPQPVGIGRFVRDKRWLGCMDSPDKPAPKVNMCACGKPVHGPRFDKCTDCLALAYVG